MKYLDLIQDVAQKCKLNAPQEVELINIANKRIPAATRIKNDSGKPKPVIVIQPDVLEVVRDREGEAAIEFIIFHELVHYNYALANLSFQGDANHGGAKIKELISMTIAQWAMLDIDDLFDFLSTYGTWIENSTPGVFASEVFASFASLLYRHDKKNALFYVHEGLKAVFNYSPAVNLN